jgi:hypothetical protein
MHSNADTMAASPEVKRQASPEVKFAARTAITTVRLFIDEIINADTAVDYLQEFQIMHAKANPQISVEPNISVIKRMAIVQAVVTHIQKSLADLNRDMCKVFSTCCSYPYTRLDLKEILGHLGAKYKPYNAARALMEMHQGGAQAPDPFMRYLKDADVKYRGSVDAMNGDERYMNEFKQRVAVYDAKCAKGETVNEQGMHNAKAALRKAISKHLQSIKTERADFAALDEIIKHIVSQRAAKKDAVAAPALEAELGEVEAARGRMLSAKLLAEQDKAKAKREMDEKTKVYTEACKRHNRLVESEKQIVERHTQLLMRKRQADSEAGAAAKSSKAD